LFQLRLWFWLGFIRYLTILAIFCHSWQFEKLTYTFMGPRDHCSYGKLSVISGFSALSVSESNQETLLTNQVVVKFCFSKNIISFFILHESCSSTILDEFGILNHLISISEAQDIPIWISNVKEEISVARRILTRVLH